MRLDALWTARAEDTCSTLPALLQQAYYYGRASARQYRLQEVEAEDCAATFVEKIYRYSANLAGSGSAPPASPAWMRRCALNHASNFARDLRRRSQYELACGELSHGREHTAGDVRKGSQSPDAMLLRDEFWVTIRGALNSLTPEPRAMFVRHHIYGETVRQLALRFGRSDHAVEQALLRARRRVGAELARRGMDRGSLSAYVALY